METSPNIKPQRTMASHFFEDKDLDDAALWAIIDSAEASFTSSKSLALKFPNSHSPICTSSPKLPQNSNNSQFKTITPNPDQLFRPYKISRRCGSEVSDVSSPLVMVRTPVTNTSPEAYLSPQIGSVVSPGSYVNVGSEEKDVVRHCLNGRFPSVSLFRDYQNAAMAILEKSDYTMISGHPYIKKSGWRKISFYFNVSYEIKDKTIEFDENRNVQRAEFIVRAYMQGGRFSDGWGSCEKREKRFSKPNHDIPSTAETRAKNKACQDLIGIGEYQPGKHQFHQ